MPENNCFDRRHGRKRTGGNYLLGVRRGDPLTKLFPASSSLLPVKIRLASIRNDGFGVGLRKRGKIVFWLEWGK